MSRRSAAGMLVLLLAQLAFLSSTTALSALLDGLTGETGLALEQADPEKPRQI